MSAPAAYAQPNLTPILDMVFQLITFFMLVINFKNASMDHNLKLPVIGSAVPSTKGAEDVLVLNINEAGQVVVYGEIKDVEKYVASEAETSRLTARRLIPGFRVSDELPTQVVIRADRATPFHLLNRVMVTCQTNGFRQFSLKAWNRKE
jgi:biopolymer transport protein ExbD